MITITKDPQADLDYGLDWSKWLGSDTIVASTWTPAPGSGVTVHDDFVSADGKKTTAWLRGGTDGYSGLIATNHVVTADGRAEDRSFYGRIAAR